MQEPNVTRSILTLFKKLSCKGILGIQSISIKDQITNVMTKSLPTFRFHLNRNKLQDSQNFVLKGGIFLNSSRRYCFSLCLLLVSYVILNISRFKFQGTSENFMYCINNNFSRMFQIVRKWFKTLPLLFYANIILIFVCQCGQNCT